MAISARHELSSQPAAALSASIFAIALMSADVIVSMSVRSASTDATRPFKKATLSLKVRPQITPDDRVIMTLAVHKDSRGTDTPAGPAIDTKAVTTEVLVDNGGTVVIGGIYEQQESNQTNKIPVLGDLPYIGFLFKQNQKFDNKSELIVFITPRILKESLTLR